MAAAKNGVTKAIMRVEYIKSLRANGLEVEIEVSEVVQTPHFRKLVQFYHVYSCGANNNECVFKWYALH